MNDAATPANGSGAALATLDLQDHGRKLLSALYAVSRALRFYPIENEVVQQSVDSLQEQTVSLLEAEGLLDVGVVGDFFFLNGTRLRIDLANFATFGSFSSSLLAHGLGEIQVERGVQRQEWTAFLSLLLRNPADDPYSSFLAAMASASIEHIAVGPATDEHVPALEEEEALEAAKRTYLHSVKTAKDVLTDVRMGRAVNARKIKRAVQTIVDQVLDNEPAMIAMSALRDCDDYTFVHCVNVCIFSLVIGQRIGLGKLQLYELGLGALFHDVGKQRIGAEILNRPGPLTDDEWARLQEHPTEGLLALFDLHGFLDVPYRQMLMAYEHHMRADGSGYPSNARPREPGLFSRIVTVADTFDAATSMRSYKYEAKSPSDILREMVEDTRSAYDQLLVKALINAIGVYPVGTLVILDSMEMGVVVTPNPDPSHMHLPKVTLISDGSGMALAEPLTVDLSELDPMTGHPRRTIIKHADAQRYGVRTSDYLL